MNKRGILLSFILGLPISLLFLYLSLRNVPIEDLLVYIGHIQYIWTAPAIGVIVFSFILRVLRWKIIVNQTGAATSSSGLSFKSAYHPLMISFMLNCILPGRLGELGRPAVLYKTDGVAFSTGLATVAVERLFDMICLVLFLAIVLKYVNIDPAAHATFGGYTLNKDILLMVESMTMKATIVLLLGLVALLFPRSRGLIETCVVAACSLLFRGRGSFALKMKKMIKGKVHGLFKNIEAGLKVVGNPLALISCIVLSILVWVTSALGYYLVGVGFPGLDLNYMEAAAAMVLICFFIALPSVPGYWGVWEAASLFALMLFGVDKNEAALGYTLMNHVVQLFPIILMGMISALILGTGVLKNAMTAPYRNKKEVEKLEERTSVFNGNT